MSYMHSQESGIPADDVGDRSDECRNEERGSDVKRAKKKNTGHESRYFEISQEETGFHLL